MKKIIALSVLSSLLCTPVFAATSPDEKLSKLLSEIYNKSPSALGQLPAAGYGNGLAGFMKTNNLVLTYSEGSCSVVKTGVCQITAYITRASYKKHRTNDPYAFCGAMVTWEASEKNMKKWSPTNGLATHIADGDRDWSLVMIDEKNRGYCK